MSRQLVVYGVVFVVILVVGFFGSYFYALNKRGEQIDRIASQLDTPQITTNSTINTKSDKMTFGDLKKYTVPEPGEKPQERGVAIPSTVLDTASGTTHKTRTYQLNLTGNIFPVDKFIVHQYDILRIKLISNDYTYDVSFPSMGIKTTVEANSGKTVEFQAVSTGTYPFYCANCKPDKGSLIVMAEK